MQILLHDGLGLTVQPARPIHVFDRQTLATNIGGTMTPKVIYIDQQSGV